MSLPARLMNVFAGPGELFEAVASSRFCLSNWLAPSLIVGLLGLVYVLVLFSHPVLVQQVRDLQDREIQKQVDAGKIPPEAAEKVREMYQGIGMTIGKVVGGIFAVIGSAVIPLWWAFLAWLASKLIFRPGVGYLRALEVAGLASLVGGLGVIVTLFLALGMGNMFAGPHLGLLVKDFDLSNRAHVAMGALNLFALWQLALISLGLSKLMGRPFGPVALVMLGVWIAWKGFLILVGTPIGMGQMAL